jgi:hypothetical protein
MRDLRQAAQLARAFGRINQRTCDPTGLPSAGSVAIASLQFAELQV